MNRSIRLGRRTLLIILVVVEAILTLLNYSAFTNPQISIVLGGAPAPALALIAIITLALGVVVGALCRRWQGAVALAMLAALPTVARDILMFPREPLASANIIALMAPLVIVGLLGWLLRYASAELDA